MGTDANKTYGLSPEIAWNYGLSFTQYLPLGGRDLELVGDLYYTNFTNQVVVDWDNHIGIASVIKKNKGKEKRLIPLLMILFAIGGSLDRKTHV